MKCICLHMNSKSLSSFAFRKIIQGENEMKIEGQSLEKR